MVKGHSLLLMSPAKRPSAHVGRRAGNMQPWHRLPPPDEACISGVMRLGSMKVTARQVDDKIELGERDEQVLDLGSFALRSPTARIARVLNVSGGDHVVPVRDDDGGPTCQCSRSNHGSSASGRVP